MFGVKVYSCEKLYCNTSYRLRAVVVAEHDHGYGADGGCHSRGGRNRRLHAADTRAPAAGQTGTVAPVCGSFVDVTDPRTK